MGLISIVPYSESLKRCWEQVFVSNDPFGNPFTKEVESCLVMYPTYCYHLDRVQYEALKKTMLEMGEECFFLSIVEFAGDFLREGSHWCCWLPEYDEYTKVPLVLENCLYSSKGSFGIIVSHECHALVGGKREWISVLKKYYHTWEVDRKKLQEDWPIEMVKPVLAAMYLPRLSTGSV